MHRTKCIPVREEKLRLHVLKYTFFFYYVFYPVVPELLVLWCCVGSCFFWNVQAECVWSCDGQGV